jgi:hypothetical protein
LLETKHEVAGLEGLSAYPSAVVVAEALLINCRPGESYVSHLIQQIKGIFQCRLRIFFDIDHDGYDSDRQSLCVVDDQPVGNPKRKV